MNVETCGHVADPIVMTHAFVELRDGVVARHSTKNGSIIRHLNIPLLSICSEEAKTQICHMLPPSFYYNDNPISGPTSSTNQPDPLAAPT